jgi:TP53 regulating kinase and related kinases
LTPPGETDAPKGTLLYRGAEADVVKASWCGMPAVYKVRKTLPYRLPELDNEIRRQRTLREGEMIRSAKRAGVRAPYLYYVDPGRATLVMEFIEGERMKDLVSSLPPREVSLLFERLGAEVARLHAAGIMHGDLTTANVMRRDGELVFVDFGLSLHSSRVEDHAVDLRLIKETIVGAHSEVAQSGMASLLRGYCRVVGDRRAAAVLRQLRAIERRGRYARVE